MGEIFKIHISDKSLISRVCIYVLGGGVYTHICIYYLYFCKSIIRASLVVQWLRICLPMQGTRVRALVWEDPTCRGAAGPVSRNY